MKLNKIIPTLLMFMASVFMTGCVKTENKIKEEIKDGAKIVFQLEGGTYANCEGQIVAYYKCDDNEEISIYEPVTYADGSSYSYPGFTFEGWYKTKTTNSDGKVEYTNKWDFTKDKVTKEGVTLYARWDKVHNYSYNVCYYDDEGNKQILGSYTTSEGVKFNDVLNHRSRRTGYTPIRAVDKDGNPWDENFTHPGGEGDVAIDVFYEYVKGSFAIVKTASDLRINKTKNIYLANDIDLGGATFSFSGYNRIFMGNGHTISNFKIQYSANKNDLILDYEDSVNSSLAISLFGDITGATITDVKFKDVSVDISTSLQTTSKIYLVSLGLILTDTTIENVEFEGTFKVSKLPNGAHNDPVRKEEMLRIITDRCYYQKDPNSKIENVTITLLEIN